MSPILKAFCLVLLLAFIGLQVRLWSDEGGLPAVWSLERLIAEQRDENAIMAARNEALLAEVRDLQQGDEAIEERARSDLGMIRDGEVFFLAIGRSER